MRIVTVIGARPQFIKAASVSRIIQKSCGIKETIVHTGQHFDENMSSVFFREMEIPLPDYNFEINSLTHGAMTGRMIEAVEKVLLSEKPDMVLVYGDTNSTLAGAVAARKLNIALAHIEAGLRSFNNSMPEEINRILTDRISNILFCPTDNAVNNLHHEGFGNFSCEIHQVGDVMYDTALYYGAMSEARSNILKKLDLNKSAYVLCTIHRQENTDNPANLRSIATALNTIHKETRVILPLHPRTRNILHMHNISLSFEPIEPVGYFDIVELLKNCNIVITDSGGMQKEAFFFKKYCITMRQETEWIELVHNHFNILTGSDHTQILKVFAEMNGKQLVDSQSLYGSGNASQKIVDILKSYKT